MQRFLFYTGAGGMGCRMIHRFSLAVILSLHEIVFRYRSERIFQKISRSYCICFYIGQQLHNAAIFYEISRKAGSEWRGTFFCASARVYDQYGRNCDLPGNLCIIYCKRIRDSFKPDSADYDRPDLYICIHRRGFLISGHPFVNNITGRRSRPGRSSRTETYVRFAEFINCF